MHEWVIEQKFKLQRGIVGRMIVHPPALSISRPNFGTSSDQRTVRVGVQECNLFLQSCRLCPVVVILAGNILAARKAMPRLSAAASPISS